MSLEKRRKKTVKNDVSQTPQKDPPLIETPSLDEEIIQRNIEQTISEAVQTSDEEILYQRFVQTLPKWIKAPFAYITPRVPEQIDTWRKNWADLIISYARTLRQHIINLQELREKHPFRNKENNRQLSMEQLQKIASYLEEQGLLRWIEPPLRVRVLWKTNEQLSKELYDHMIETGKAVEYWSLLDLRRIKSEDWALLPIDELKNVCEILVQKGLAKWIDKEKTILEFQII